MDEKIDLTEDRMFRKNPLVNFFDEEDMNEPDYDEELLELFCGKTPCPFYGTDRGSWRMITLSRFVLTDHDSKGDYYYDHRVEEFSENKFREGDSEWNLIRLSSYIKFWDSRYKKFSELVSSTREVSTVNNQWEDERLYESFLELVSSKNQPLRGVLKASKYYLDQEPDTNQEMKYNLVYKNISGTGNHTNYYRISCGDICGNSYYLDTSYNPERASISDWFRTFLTYHGENDVVDVSSYMPGTFTEPLAECDGVKMLYNVIETDLDDSILDRLRLESSYLSHMPVNGLTDSIVIDTTFERLDISGGWFSFNQYTQGL